METTTVSPLDTVDFKSFLSDSGIIPNGTQIDFFIQSKILWMGAGVLLVLFTILSLIFVYHWLTYAYKPAVVGFASVVYFTGAFIIFSVILVTLLSYSTLA